MRNSMGPCCRSVFPILVLGLAAALGAEAQVPRGREILVNVDRPGHRQWAADVAMAADGSFVVVWVDNGNVLARLFAANGRPRTGEVRVSGGQGRRQFFPAVAMRPGGEFVVVWEAATPAGLDSIFGRRFNADGRALGRRFPLAPSSGRDQHDPDVGMAPDGSFVAVWIQDDGEVDEEGFATTDVYVRRFGPDARPREAPVPLSFPGLPDLEPAVAVGSDGGHVVAYTTGPASLDDQSLDDVHGATFSPDGTLTARFSADTPDTEHRFQNGPAVARADDGGFLLVWHDSLADLLPDEDGETADSLGLLGQRFAADGTPGELFHVNAETRSDQYAPSAAALPGGEWLVAWTSGDQELTGIFVRRFGDNGAPLGPEVRVNRFADGQQSFPSLAVAPDGRGVVAWTTEGREGPGFDIAARRLLPPG